MAELGKISKEKGIELCAELLYAGKGRKEIVQEITKKYKASLKTVDNWLKQARPVAEERKVAAKQVQDRIDADQASATTKRLNLTREAMLERLGEIIYYGKKKENPIQVTEGGELEEQEDETTEVIIVKATDVIKAIQVVNEMQGYNAPEKLDHTTNGQPIQQQTTLIIKPRSARKDGGSRTV